MLRMAHRAGRAAPLAQLHECAMAVERRRSQNKATIAVAKSHGWRPAPLTCTSARSCSASKSAETKKAILAVAASITAPYCILKGEVTCHEPVADYVERRDSSKHEISQSTPSRARVGCAGPACDGNIDPFSF